MICRKRVQYDSSIKIRICVTAKGCPIARGEDWRELTCLLSTGSYSPFFLSWLETTNMYVKHTRIRSSDLVCVMHGFLDPA